MSRRMLINAQSAEELRIAIIDGNTLENYRIEVAERGLSRGNIYRGVVANVQPGLNAAFVDYGVGKHGFLTIQDVVAAAYHRQPEGAGRPRIEHVLERGRPLVVQVVREAEGQKGASLTTNLSLAGRYLVLTPYDETRGVSRKVEDDDTRKKLKEHASKLRIPAGCGVIVRTAALGQNRLALNRDLNALLRLWKRITSEIRHGKGIQLLYSDQDLILQTLRDYLDNSVEEVLVDDDAAFGKTEEYVRAFMPRTKIRLVRYAERAPLFAHFNIEPQIDRIDERVVDLPGGGSIVIDPTEALTAVDVNSGRGSRAASQEEMALATNLEAAEEVARQLRLRDIGGLVVVDFIDMRAFKSRRKLEKALNQAMKADKARFELGRLSSNGLLEINRQRLQQAIHLRTHRSCPTCKGTGRIASPELVGLRLLRRIEARATMDPVVRVRISLHPELADAFQNGRRHEIASLEKEFEIRVEVIASNRLHRGEQEIAWFERPAQAEAAPAPAPVERTERRGRKRRRGRRRRGSAGAGEVEQPAAGEEAVALASPSAAQVDAGAAQEGFMESEASLLAPDPSVLAAEGEVVPLTPTEAPGAVYEQEANLPVPVLGASVTPVSETPPAVATGPEVAAAASEATDAPPASTEAEAVPAAAASEEAPARPKRRRRRYRSRRKTSAARPAKQAT